MSILDRLVEKYDLTLMLGVSRQAINAWLINCIPPLRAMQIEYMTEGEFKAVDLINPNNLDRWDEILLNSPHSHIQ